MLTPPECVAFDLDGTLLSCRERQVAVAIWAGRVVGVAVDPRRFWALKRRGLSTHAALLFTGVDDSKARRVATLWRRAVEASGWLELDSPLPGALLALSTLRRRGVDVMVITARRRVDQVRQQVRRQLALDDTKVTVVHPDNAAAAKAVVLQSVSPSYYVGDTESDAMAAQWANIPFVGVTSGQRTFGVLVRTGVSDVRGSVLAAVRSRMDGDAPQ